MASNPFGDPFESRRRTGSNRLMLSPPIKVGRQRIRREVASGRIFFQALETDGFQVPVQSRPQSRGGPARLLLQHLADRFHSGASGEWRLARE